MSLKLELRSLADEWEKLLLEPRCGKTVADLDSGFGLSKPGFDEVSARERKSSASTMPAMKSAE